MKWRKALTNPKLYSQLLFDPMAFSLGGSVTSVNQTVYYSTANADIARTLGVTVNVTRWIPSESWPPIDPNIILYNTSQIDPANGVLGAIPLRYTKGGDYVRVDNETSRFMDVYTTGPTYRYFESRESVEEELRTLVKEEAEGYVHYLSRPFGGVHFDSLDIDKAKVSMTMQFGMSPYGHYCDMAPPGLRQIIVGSQMTNALARLKFKGQYIISQGIRALPFEFQWDRLNNRAAGLSAIYLFPFALSFLLPNFVTILVQEKEGRHRILMAMVSAGFICFVNVPILLSIYIGFCCNRGSDFTRCLLYLEWA